jgi:hypothetical protein
MTPNELLANQIGIGGKTLTLIYNHRAFASAEHALKRKFVGAGSEEFWNILGQRGDESNEAWAHRLISTPGVVMEIATLIWIGLPHHRGLFRRPEDLISSRPDDKLLTFGTAVEAFAVAMAAVVEFFRELGLMQTPEMSSLESAETPSLKQ